MDKSPTSQSLLPLPPSLPPLSGTSPLPWGQYRAPFESMDLASRPIDRAPLSGVRSRMRLKEWHYTSVCTESLFFAFGLVQLGYVSNAFAYWMDPKNGQRVEMTTLRPMGTDLSFAPSSTRGVTRYRHGAQKVDVTYDGDRGHVSFDLCADQGDRLRGSLKWTTEESLALLYDLGGGRPAYTHKAAGMPATIDAEWQRASVSPAQGARQTIKEHGSCVLDWTRSYALRHTQWQWASFARFGDGDSSNTPLNAASHLGLNLSSLIYDDAHGNSQENAYWVGGKVTPIGGVRFEVPAQPAAQRWHIRSLNDDAIDLHFTPLGARSQSMNLGVLRSRFVQPYGRFEGRIGPHTIRDAFGVVEDHDSLW